VSKLTVITTNAGAGTLAVHVEGPSKVAIVCTELDEGYDFTYTPMAAGNYMIVIKYCSVTIAGCPFKTVVTGTLLFTTVLLSPMINSYRSILPQTQNQRRNRGSTFRVLI